MHLVEQPVCSPWLRHDALRMYNLLVCSPAVWHVPTAMRAFLMLVTLGGAGGRGGDRTGRCCGCGNALFGVFGSGGITC